MKKLFLILYIIFNALTSGTSQVADPQFTQFYSVPLYLAPSFAGATQQHRLSTTYRSQWLGLNGNFNTYALAYDHYFNKYNSGVGIMMVRDVSGTGKLGFTYGALLYSYDFLVLKTFHVRPGLSFVYSKLSLDFKKLVFIDQIDTNGDINGATNEISPSFEQRGYIDGSFSTLLYTESTWQGITIDHLLRPNVSLYQEKMLKPLRYTFYGGTKLISKGRLLKPSDESISLAYQLRFQGDFKQLDLGLYWLNAPIVLGVWYRGIPVFSSKQFVRGDAVAFLTGLRFYQLSLSYSYDFTISNLMLSTKGAHEVTLIYEFRTTKKKKFHAIPCPEF